MPPPTHFLSTRDISSDAANVRNTFSSWDSCMSEAYCKWPAIVGIIVGSLILLSIIWCCARCLCCGAECCCGCLSCFNRCCPSPRNRKNDGYQQAPPQPQPYGGAYQSHPPPVYGGAGYGYGGGYRGPQTATFDAPSYNNRNNKPVNEDALPAMPSWDNATSKHVEEEEEDVEMEKLDGVGAGAGSAAGQQESLLKDNDRNSGGRYYNNPVQQTSDPSSVDLGTMHPSPYHDYANHQQFVPSPISTRPNSEYPPTYRTRPASSVYTANAYAPSIPPSYHTNAPSVVSPTQQSLPASIAVGRKPVQGTWRDV